VRANSTAITGAGRRARGTLLWPAGGAPNTSSSHPRPTSRGCKPITRARAARLLGERKSKTRLHAADNCYNHPAGTAALVPGALSLPAARTATQLQERLRDALTILHVALAQKRGLPMSSAGHSHASRRPRGPMTEVDRQDGQSLSAVQVLSFADELSRVLEDQAAVLLSVNDRERR
jgi:hypothetical protein